MRRLFVVRHAKSSWKDQGQDDFDRPLNDRGIRDAPVMAQRLHEKVSGFDVVLCSPARRTSFTLDFFKHEFALRNDAIEMKRSIYDASFGELVSIISSLPDSYRNVMLIGHNPGLSMLVHYFTGQNVNMPTCAIAEIGFGSFTWMEASENCATLVSFDYPKKTS
ncbi:MAG: histidine phosphatase family protein [Flavobacteriales bacterium]|nr:histidine phosphatase family protein [Flavobacteriales bacterium]